MPAKIKVMFSGIFKNTLSLVLARGISVIFSLLIIRLLTSYLGKDGYGVYGFVTALVLLFGTIADWGTSFIATREASQNKENKNKAKIFNTTFVARFTLTLLSFFLLNIFIRLYSPWKEFVVPVTIASFVLLFLSLKTSINIIFQTSLKLERAAISEVVGTIAFFTLAFFFVRQQGGINLVMFSWVLATALAFIVGLRLMHNLAQIRLLVDIPTLKNLVRESLPMGALLLVFSVYNRVDILILERFWGVGEVGIYNLSYKVHENLILPAAFLMSAAFPILSRMFKKRRDNLRILYKNLFGLLVFLGGSAALLAFIFSPFIISILTGPQQQEFNSSNFALRLLVFATFFSYLNHLTGFSLIAFGKQRISLGIGAVALIFNVLANLIFIPLYSWIAASLVTVFTELLIFALSSIFIWRILRVFPSPLFAFPILKELLLLRKLRREKYGKSKNLL